MIPQSYNHSLVNRVHRHFITPLIKNKRSASYFTLTISLFSISFFGIFAIRPTIITAISLFKSVSDLKKLNIDYENKIGSLVQGQSEYEGIRSSLPLIEEAIPQSSDFHKLVAALENFASRSDVSINQLQVDSNSISKLSSSGKLQKYGFNLITIGSYSSTFSYLQHLLNWRRIVTIDSLDFATEGSSASGLLRVSIKGQVYYEP